MTAPAGKLEYVGFWVRVAAQVFDTVLLSILSWPLGRLLYRSAHAPSSSWDPNGPGGLDLSQIHLQFSMSDWLLDVFLPAIVVLLFWMTRQATPGKMLFGARVVDATSGLPIKWSQALVRYLGYYVSLFGLGLGFVWVGIDRRKQGWHDKMANTIVVRRRLPTPEPPGI